MAYPLENMLREPVDLVPAITSVVGACLLVLWPHVFAIDFSTALAIACALIVHASWRARRAVQIIRYRQGLDVPIMYKIAPQALPDPPQQLFLGRGFLWTSRHTQRWYDLQLELGQQAAKSGRSARSQFMTHWRQDGFAVALTRTLSPLKHAGKPTVAQEFGGSLGLHGVEPIEQDVCLNASERPGHVIVLGTTRVGKSRLLELLVAQDIRRGDVVVVLDPKGDLGVLQRMHAEAVRAGRGDNFYFFHLGYPELSARYNPIGDFTRITEIADRIANGVPGEGSAAAFKQFVWHFVNGTMRGLVALGQRPTYKLLRQHLNDCDGLTIKYLERLLDRSPQAHSWREDVRSMKSDKSKGGDRELRERNDYAWRLLTYVHNKSLHDDVAESLIALISHPRAHFEKLVASVKPLLEKLTNGKAGDLLSPDYADPLDLRPVFDWTTAIGSGGIVYVGLDALSSTSVAGAVGSSMLADLTSVASRIYKHGLGHGQSTPLSPPRLCIHADEFNELIGDEFIPMINKAGGAGFQVVAYSQTAADIEAKIGGPAKARQIEGNFNTRIYLRVLDELTAEGFTKRLNEVYVANKTAVSSVSDVNDPQRFGEFASSNEDRLSLEKVGLLEPSDLGRLPKGQAFALLNGNQLYKLRIPLFETAGDPCFNDSAMAIAKAIAKRYEDAPAAENEPQRDARLLANAG